MRVIELNGKQLGNACSVYNFYKKNTGRGLQADIVVLSRLIGLQKKLENPESITDEDIKLLNDVDIGNIITNMYVALRQAGDPEAAKKNAKEIADEISMDDINNPDFVSEIVSLVGPKKG